MGNRDLPKYLSAEKPERRDDYWCYRHPEIRRRMGKAALYWTLSRDEAIQRAEAMNAKFQADKDEREMEDILASDPENPGALFKRKRGPKSRKSFSTVADDYYDWWSNRKYADPEDAPKESTRASARQRIERMKGYFGDAHIDTITAHQVGAYLSTIEATGEHNRIGRMLIKVFKRGINLGVVPGHLPNPAEQAYEPKVEGRTKRHPMTPDQFEAIYERSPEWLQIALDICLQTSLRRQDIFALRWDDIHDDKLFVVVEKSKTQKLNRASLLVFDLKKLPRLRDAINRAREMRMATQGKRKSFRDCPFIIMNSSFERIRESERKEHPLQVLPRYANDALKFVRDQAIEERPDLWLGMKPENMPAYHGVRNLSLQTLEDQGVGEESLQVRAAHQDVIITRDVYLDRTAMDWNDTTLQSVDLSQWKDRSHPIADYLLRHEE